MDFRELTKEELLDMEIQIKMELYNRRLAEVRKAMNNYSFTFTQSLRDRVQILEHIVSHELTSTKRIQFIESCLNDLEIILNIDR